MGDFIIDISIDSNDWVTKALDSLFNPSTVIVSGIFVYDMVLCSVGGLLLVWLSMRAILATAQHGEPLGKHSEVWFPIRFIVAIGLMFPLPNANLSAAQLFMINMGKYGSSFANKVWNIVVDSSAGLNPLVMPEPPNISELAHAAWMIDVCIALHNRIAEGSDLEPIALVTKEFDDRYVLTADGKIQGQCGYVVFTKPGDPLMTGSTLDATPQVRQIWQTHTTAMVGLFQDLNGPAQQFAAVVSTDQPMTDVNVGAILSKYQSQYLQTARSLVDAQGFTFKQGGSSSFREAFATESKNGGWAFAGAWSLRLASLNGEVIQAMNDLPGAAMPRLAAYQGDANEGFVASLHSADNWWMKNAAKTAKEIDKKAYLAGLNKDTIIPDVAKAEWWYKMISLSQNDTNPVGEIISLGHSLILSADAIIVGAGALDLASNAPVGPGILGKVAKFTGFSGFEKMMTMVYLLAGAIWLSGIFLAYVLPMIPYVYWMLFVARYLMRVGLAVLAGPLWSVSHLDLDGEGMGDKASHGWYALFDVFLRPAIAVLSLVMAYAVFILLAKLFSLTFYPALRNTLAGHMGGFSGLVAFTVMAVLILTILMTLCMETITSGADEILEYLGTRFGRMGDLTGHVEKGTAKTVAAIGQMSHALQSALVRHPQSGDEGKKAKEAKPTGSNPATNNISKADPGK